MEDEQCYWGVKCRCGNLHPVRLGSIDAFEPIPYTGEFVIDCPLAKESLRFDIHELIKYFGPAVDNFQPHRLFQ
jgi:hypothetical protein